MAERQEKPDIQSICEAWYEGHLKECKLHDESLQKAIQHTLELLHNKMLPKSKTSAKHGSTFCIIPFDYKNGSYDIFACNKLFVYNWNKSTDVPVVQNAIMTEFETKWGVSTSPNIDGLSTSYYNDHLHVMLRWPQSIARFKKRKLDEANEANKKANVQPDTKPTVNPDEESKV